MEQNRFQIIEEVFHKAMDLEPPDRASFLDEACEGDLELRGEVESLLAHSDGRTERIELSPSGEGFRAGIEKIAAGPVEILLRPGQANLLRIALRPEADTIEVAKVYRDTARVEGRVMIFCEDPKARAAAVAGEEAVIDAPMALKAPVARLLDLLGMKGETAGPRTALTATVVSRDLAEGSVMFKSGRAEMGLFALIVLSLTK